MVERIHRCIDLLQAGHPIYFTHVRELSYDNGRQQAETWADFLIVDFEHAPFDVVGLLAFMHGLVDGGPTPDGYRMPTVIATLPSNCRTRTEVEANTWQIRHVLSAGVHGILHTHARDSDAVRAFVGACRYPFQSTGVGDQPGPGQRGAGGQETPAKLWGVTPQEYVKIADPWPLNPDGQLMLGLKIEDRQGLEIAEGLAGTAGLAFAEWGPGDMGMSFGYSDAHDPPYPVELETARRTVKAACDKFGLAFLSGWYDRSKSEQENVRFLFDWGVKVIYCETRETKEVGLRLRPR